MVLVRTFIPENTSTVANMETSHTDTASAADRTTKNSIAFIDATDFGTNEVMVGRESAASLEQSPIVPRKRGATEAQLAPRGVTKILKLKVKYPGPNIEFEQEKKSGPAKAAKKNPCAPKQKLNQDYKANQAKPNPCGQPKAWALVRATSIVLQSNFTNDLLEPSGSVRINKISLLAKRHLPC